MMLVVLPTAARAEDSRLLTADEMTGWWRELSLPRKPVTAERPSLVDPATGEPNHLFAGFFSAGILAGSALNAFTETPHQSFHFTNEGFFGRDTYVGGADKASHFVDYFMVSKELANFYQVLGYDRGPSMIAGAAVSTMAGLITELGDGTSFFGFSYEDLVMDTLGAGMAAMIAYTRTDDLFGFRRGFIPYTPNQCCGKNPNNPGRDYSGEIYTADLKLAGVAQRTGALIGPLRYLYFSVTYGSSGYSCACPDKQERLVGFELGLNFETILNDVGVQRNTWWGYAIHVVMDNLRIPFTSIGVRYDLNHGRWHGPGP